MEPSLLFRVIRSTMKGFFGTLIGDLISAAGIVVVVVFACLAINGGKQKWDAVEQTSWVLCCVIAYHWVSAIVLVWKEEADRSCLREVESGLYLPDQQKERHFVSGNPTSHYKLRLVGIGAAFTILSVGALTELHVLIARHKTETAETFSVTLGPAFWNHKRNQLSGWWLGDVRSAGGKKIVADIRHASVVVYVTATNLQSTECLIRYYGLQVKTEKGKWVDLRRMDAGSDATFLVFENTGFKAAHLVEMPDLLDKSITNGKVIKPGQIFKGWIFFEYPKSAAGDTFVPIFRFVLHDMRGVDYTSREQGPEVKSSYDLQGGGMIPIQKMDLSNVPIIDDAR